MSEFTTEAAADFLNVSRPFLATLLETKQIASHGVDGDLRVCLADLEMFKQRHAEARDKALDELAAQAQELGMGY